MPKFKLTKFALSTLAFAVALAVGATSSFAAVGAKMGASIASISSDNSGSPMRVTVYTTDGYYYYIGYVGCTTTANADQLKLWESMLMSAFLSGKKVNIWWNDSGCAGSPAITSLQVTN